MQCYCVQMIKSYRIPEETTKKLPLLPSPVLWNTKPGTADALNDVQGSKRSYVDWNWFGTQLLFGDRWRPAMGSNPRSRLPLPLRAHHLYPLSGREETEEKGPLGWHFPSLSAPSGIRVAARLQPLPYRLFIMNQTKLKEKFWEIASQAWINLLLLILTRLWTKPLLNPWQIGMVAKENTECSL